MSVRTVIQIGHPNLKAVNKTISDFSDLVLRQLIQDLTDTMRATELVGIAAPQIGENWQVFLTEPRETKSRSKDQTDILRIFINPTVIASSLEKVEIYEGCGSVVQGDLFGPVLRPKEVTVKAFDETGKKFRFTADGLLARVILHEMDHLQGKEFISCVSDYDQVMTFEYYKEKREDPALKVAAIITKKEFILSS